MHKFRISKIWRMIAVLVLIFSLVPFSAGAQESPDTPETFEAGVFAEIAPVMMELEELAEPPTLSEEQLANLQWGVENTPGALPVLEGDQAEPVGPESGTETMEAEVRLTAGQPLLPGDAIVYKQKRFGSSLPAGQHNVMEVSVDAKGKKQFATGNFFAARSNDKGGSFTYVNPYAGMADFCCDQVVRHDMARDLWLWIRMGYPDVNGENRFVLSVDHITTFTGGWSYSFRPEDINPNWQNVWWDYPAMSLTADYLYITWNLFDQPGFYDSTVILRFSLDALAARGAASGSYLQTTAWATLKPLDGADHTMYFASTWPNTVPQNSRIGIYRWRDMDNFLNFWDKTITAWTFTNRGDAHCGTPNWAARYDQRALAGARYNIDATNIQNPGRNIIAWWWNVGEGGNFSVPYIEGAAFYEDTITQVAGLEGRPLIWNPELCFAYPDVASNVREDLGIVFNYADGPAFHKPKSAFMLNDDYQQAMPGGIFYAFAASTAGPSDQVWGDYNTVRAAHGPAIAFTAGVHVIRQASDCSYCAEPVVISFGRERDKKSWQQW